MLILTLFSGLMSLSAQVLYQKIVSLTSGDLYTIFATVSLTFIFGTALGGFLSPKLRRHLPHLEIIGGLYTYSFLILTPQIAAIHPPSALLILGLFPPAFIFGTHLPLYAYYFRQKNYSLIYALYHWGPIVGLLGLEWYFTHAGSINILLMVLGTFQVLVGVILFSQRGRFDISGSASAVSLFKHRVAQRSAYLVFAISALSFFQISWALKSQILATEAFRLQSTMIAAAVFFWMALAGSLSFLFRKLPRSVYFVLWVASLVFLDASLEFLPLQVTSQINGTLENYFLISFILALLFTFPVFFSSLFFVRETRSLNTVFEIDAVSGFLNLSASLGNILGFLAAAVLAPWLWRLQYFATACCLGALIFALLAWRDFPKLRSLPFSILAVLVGFSMIFLNTNQAEILLQNRVGPDERSKSELDLEELRTSAFSNLALLSAQEKNSKIREQNLLYLVDGHLSHDLKREQEITVGLVAAKYFQAPVNKSLVIGIGAGQSAWAIQSFSLKTDLVDISPAAIETLDLLTKYNNGLKQKENLQFILQDGFNFLKNCPAHSYDLILNTSTYPGNFNASKLYSDEFVAQAKNCLTEQGVLESYFDAGSVQTLAELDAFLAPLQKHFKYVDIVFEPYPLVFAYNQDRSLQLVNADSLLREQDKAFFQNLEEKGQMNLSMCQQVLRKIPALANSERSPSSLDRSYIESNSIQNMVKSLASGWKEVPLQEILPSVLTPTCE